MSLKKYIAKAYFCLFLFGIGPINHAQAQNIQAPKFNYIFELGTFYSINNKMPFWIKSNQFGALPTQANTTVYRNYFESKKDTLNKKYSFSYCFDLSMILGKQTRVVLPEAFIQQKLGILNVSLGRKKQIHGIVDSTLSSGSITWSGNAMPLPEIQISIPEYKRFLIDQLAIKGHFSHAWFGNQTYVDDFYLHQKSFYARLGKADSKIKFYAGILHNAQWGGTPKYKITAEEDQFINGKFPSNFYTFRQVVLPLKALKDTTLGYTSFETDNRFGNHLGQVDLGGTVRFKTKSLLLYKQTIFETGQTFSSLTNTDDGLYGISLKNLNSNSSFDKFVFEVLFTRNQGRYRSGISRLLGIKDKQYGNAPFYFNHMQYLDGWSYQNQTIGSAFMIPQNEIKVENHGLPYLFYLNNNRILAYYFALNGKLNTIELETRVSLSKNFGSMHAELPPVSQNSFYLNAKIPMKKLKGFINVKIGIDHGDLIKDNYGTYLAYTRKW